MIGDNDTWAGGENETWGGGAITHASRSTPSHHANLVLLCLAGYRRYSPANVGALAVVSVGTGTKVQPASNH